MGPWLGDGSFLQCVPAAWAAGGVSDHGPSQEKAEQEEKHGGTVGNSGGISEDLCASESYCVCLG